MKIIRGIHMEFVPASHENPADPGVLKKVLFKKDDLSSGRVQMINWAKIPAGKGFTPHYQQDMEEIFIIIEGKAWVRVNKQEDTLGAGDALIVDPLEVHEMKSLENKPVVLVCLGIKSGDKNRKVVMTT